MSIFNYKPLDNTRGCEVSCEEKKNEERYPRVYFDVMPEQLEGLEPGAEVTIVLKGKVEGYRIDTEDDYGTGASLTVSLRQSEVKGTSEDSFISEMLSED